MVGSGGQQEDLAFQIVSAADGRTRAQVLESPFGGGGSGFELPLDLPTLERCLARFEVAVRTGRGVARLPVEGPTLPTALELGRELFEALFQGELREHLRRIQARCEGRDGAVLRLRLVLDPHDERFGLLAALPWELLFDPERQRFLARDPGSPLVRQLLVTLAPGLARRTEDPASPARILVAHADPADQAPLATRYEAEDIVQAWQGRPDVEVEVLACASLELLSQHLERHRPRVLHWCGHGLAAEGEDRGGLVFGQAGGSGQEVSANALAETLTAHRCLELVVLNACQTARPQPGRADRPFAHVAGALLARGLPAVVAMQLPIPDEDALAWSARFHRALAQGKSLDAAVATGRLALAERNPDTTAWMIPTLFTRGREVWSLTRPEEPPMPDPPVRFAPAFNNSGPVGSQFVAETVHQVNHYAERNPLDVGREALETGRRYLAQQAYEPAAEALSQAVQALPTEPDALYGLALAKLGGRRPKSLRQEEVRAIENLALAAARGLRPGLRHFLLAAFLRHDFYVLNYLQEPQPGHRELLSQASTCPRTEDDISELPRHVPAARQFVDTVLPQLNAGRT